jgi:DNA-binding CsgD family transcriptional regulator
MGRSERVKLTDVEAVFQLVQDCRDLWADARAWQAHLLEGACQLTGTAVGFYHEVRVSSDGRRSDVLDESDWGWRDSAARNSLVRMYVDYPDRAAYMPRVTQLAATAPDTDCVAVLRDELRSDREWRMSDMFNRYRRPAFLDDMIIAFSYNRQTGSTILLCTNQDLSDRRPTRRGRGILKLLTSRLAPLVGTSLVTGSQPGLHDLSPRLRQTLEALLAGYGEKQVAAHLGISRATVHEYIGDLYNRFGVEGRAPLMAYFLGRRPCSGLTSGRRALA